MSMEQNNLGLRHTAHQHVPTNDEEALAWYRYSTWVQVHFKFNNEVSVSLGTTEPVLALTSHERPSPHPRPFLQEFRITTETTHW